MVRLSKFKIHGSTVYTDHSFMQTQTFLNTPASPTPILKRICVCVFVQITIEYFRICFPFGFLNDSPHQPVFRNVMKFAKKGSILIVCNKLPLLVYRAVRVQS